MDLDQAILKQSQILARAERHLALHKLKERKADTRRKIEFGGLVIKAGMNQHAKAIILGALIEAAEALKDNPDYAKLLKTKGEAAFMGYLPTEKGETAC